MDKPTAAELLRNSLEPRVIDDVNFTLEDFVLDVVQGGHDFNIADSALSATLELTVEGASTLTFTLQDPDLALLNSDTLTRWAWGANGQVDVHGRDEKGWIRKGQVVDAKLGTVDFRLVKVAKSAGWQLTLTFEDRVISYLREHKGARSWSRAHHTRAEFILALASEVKANGGIVTFIPELTKPQPIEKRSDKMSKAQRRQRAHKGIAKGAKLTVKGADANAAQIARAQRVLDVAHSLNAPDLAMVALLCAAIGESRLGEERGSRGTTFQTTVIPESDLEGQASAFLKGGRSFAAGGAIGAAKAHADWTPGTIASHVEGSDRPGSFYDAYREEAARFVSVYGGGGGRDSLDTTYGRQYVFARGKAEDSWTAMQRLASEVNWRAFVRMGVLWYVSEQYLFAQRAELTVVEGEDGVDEVLFDLDLGAKDLIAEVTVNCRIGLWTAVPGMVVVVKGQGPADGRWLVSRVRRNLLDGTGSATVTLRKPLPVKNEPTTDLVNRSGASINSGTPGAKGSAAAAYSAAARLDAMGLPYLWGGGHNPASFAHPKGPPPGLDCSGSTCWVLAQAGMFDGKSAVTSGELASTWGHPGEGKEMTVWANAEHVWVEFKLPGKAGKRMDTSPHGDGPDGPRLRHSTRGPGGTANFTPRHWPGT